MSTKLVSVDVGYSNMAIVELTTDFKDFTVNNVYKINLSNFNETEVYLSMIKFISEYKKLFDNADLILIERQPPQGLTNIQDILAFNFSSKVKLICPRSMHKHFLISKLDYDSRKQHTVKITSKYLKNFLIFDNESRKHDIADAFCLALYYIEKNKKLEILEPEPIPENLEEFFNSFKYNPSIT
jgi:hypothetical protein